MKDVTKRFIAGAVCPSCSQMDKLVMYMQDDVQFRECVRCGYSDKQDENGNISEVKTRVNQPRAGEKSVPGSEDIQVLNLGIDVGSKTIH